MFVEKIKWLKTCKPLAQCLTQLQLAVVLAIFCFFITIIDVQGTEINSAWLGRKIYYIGLQKFWIGRTKFKSKLLGMNPKAHHKSGIRKYPALWSSHH